MPLSAAQDYPIWANILVFLTAAGFVWLAGTRLAVYVDAIARKRGMDQAFAGMLLMGVITSLPEVANTITASAIGNPALAVNNVLGSAAINVLLLAVADALIGRSALTAVVAKPGTLMQCALCMIVLTAVAIATLTGDVSIYGIGLWAVALCITSILAFWLSSRYGQRAPWAVVEDASGSLDAAGSGQGASGAARSITAPVRKTVFAGAVILIAGYTLSQTGDALAEQSGLGTGMVGFALIGLATSLPELSSIVSAVRIRNYEMAIGEILGTNFVNISLILLADIVYAGGPVVSELGRFEAVSSLLGAILTGIFLVGLLERRDPAVLRMGYDSIAVMLVFAAGLVLLFLLPPAAS